MAFLVSFKELPVARNCLRPESAPLKYKSFARFSAKSTLPSIRFVFLLGKFIVNAISSF